jgi:hypothetical protein
MMLIEPTMSAPPVIKNTTQPDDHKHVWLYPMVGRLVLPSPGGSFLRKPPGAHPSPEPIKGGGRPLDSGGFFSVVDNVRTDRDEMTPRKTMNRRRT